MAEAAKFALLQQEFERFVTEKGDSSSNVVSQAGRCCAYRLADQQQAQLFRSLEANRRAGVVTGISEKQGRGGTDVAGVMLDFDIATSRKERLSAQGMTQMAKRIVGALRQSLRPVEPVAGSEPTAAVASRMQDLGEIALFFLGRAEFEDLGGGLLKYGVHVLLPSVHVTRAYKYYLIQQLKDSRELCDLLSGMGATGSPNDPAAGPADCLDRGSAAVPALLLGCAKRGKRPYALEGVRRIDMRDCLTVSEQSPRELEERYNLVYELALFVRPPAELVYGERTAPPPLAPPRKFRCAEDVAAEVAATAQTSRNLLNSNGEIEHVRREVERLEMEDPEVGVLRGALKLLPRDFAEEYAKWFRVVLALANTGERLQPLAQEFSMRAPEKWLNGGRERLKNLWDAPSGGDGQRLTSKSIMFWARRAAPERMRLLMEGSYTSILRGYIFKHGGKLAHAMVAQVLFVALASRFAVDRDPLARKQEQLWFEFVTVGHSMEAGQVWKWRCEQSNPSELHLYMSEELPRLCEPILADIAAKLEKAASDRETKRYKALQKALKASVLSFYDEVFKSKTIKQAAHIFERANRGFIRRLDADGDIIGVGNGVLLLPTKRRPRPQLVDHHHEWAVSKFTAVCYRPFNAEEHWTRILLDGIRRIIPEPDMRVWLMMFLATGLYHGSKDPIMLFMCGSGRNAKTWLFKMAARTLSNSYATKLKIQLLTDQRENASSANPAVMQLKGRGLGYFEESLQREVLNTARLKDMVNPNDMSARGLWEKEGTFDMTATLASLSNFSFIINTSDDGTWRRIRYYNAKVKFCADPNPNNILEQKEDKRFIKEFTEDPDCQSAFLGILVHFWGRLQEEFGGDLDAVPCPTLDRETYQFRASQDMLHKFISECVVTTGNDNDVYSLNAISHSFSNWYNKNVENRRYVNSELADQLETSKLSDRLDRTQKV
ncbi:MAG: PriCT-2 domain-containing protein, partial [Sulfitobacter sp.]|nr:PriCT-2 domain-containing protein [Sulfitobacter sp.]